MAIVDFIGGNRDHKKLHRHILIQTNKDTVYLSVNARIQKLMFSKSCRNPVNVPKWAPTTTIHQPAYLRNGIFMSMLLEKRHVEHNVENNIYCLSGSNRYLVRVIKLYYITIRGTQIQYMTTSHKNDSKI